MRLAWLDRLFDRSCGSCHQAVNVGIDDLPRVFLSDCLERSRALGQVRRRPPTADYPGRAVAPACSGPGDAPGAPRRSRRPGTCRRRRRTSASPPTPGECLPVTGVQRHESRRSSARNTPRTPISRTQWGLHAVNAHLAYGHVNLLEGEGVAPGAGVTIGIFDTGIDVEHPDLRGQVRLSKSSCFRAPIGRQRATSTPTAPRWRASPRAGQDRRPERRRTGSPGAPTWPYGQSRSAGVTGFTDPISLETLAQVGPGHSPRIFNGRSSAGGTRDRKLDILNMSFGYPGIISQLQPKRTCGPTSAASIAALAQADAAEKIDPRLVGRQLRTETAATPPAPRHCPDGQFQAISASASCRGSSPTWRNSRGHSIAVVALSPDGGNLSSFLEPLRHRRRLLHRGSRGRHHGSPISGPTRK